MDIQFHQFGFCDSINKHAKNIIYFKKMLPLTKKELKSHEDAKLSKSHYTEKYRGTAYSICSLKLKCLMKFL